MLAHEFQQKIKKMITTATKRTNRKEQESEKKNRKVNCQPYFFSQMGYLQDLRTNNLMFMAALKSRDKSGNTVTSRVKKAKTKEKER